MSLGLSVFPPRRMWGEQGQRSASENMSFCLGCAPPLGDSDWGSSGKALGFGLLLFDVNVLRMGLSAEHFVQGRYCCQRWGSLCSFPLALMREDCLTNGSPQCSDCAFSLKLVFIPYFCLSRFPGEKKIGHSWPYLILYQGISALIIY